MGTVRPLPRRLDSAYIDGKKKVDGEEDWERVGWGGRGGAALWKFGRFGRLAFFRVAVLGERRMIGLHRWFEAHDCRRPAAAGQRDAFCREITRRGRLGRVGGTGDNR